MDGNGRWAKKRGLPRSAGHKVGTETLKQIIKDCHSLGISEATFYAFSSENWKRPQREVGFLMKLFRLYLKSEIQELHRNNVVFRVIGDRSGLHPGIVELIEAAEEKTARNSGIIMNIAANYGGRDEIVAAVNAIAADVKEGRTAPGDITPDTIKQHLYLKSDPDLLIRTGGEKRLSNFLLWQHSYSEFIFTDILWPDFNMENLKECLTEYEQRNRRYGAIDED